MKILSKTAIAVIAACVAAAVLFAVFLPWNPGAEPAAGSPKDDSAEPEMIAQLQEHCEEQIESIYRQAGAEKEALQEKVSLLKEENKKLEEELQYVYSSLEGVPVVRHGDRDSSKVAITIDDGLDPYWVVKALLILEEKNVKATLFPIGSAVESYPSIWRKAVEQGHELGNHTFSHRKIPEVSTMEVIGELGKWQKTVNRALGRTYGEARFFRPPGMTGFESDGKASHYQSLIGLGGLEAVVLWDVDHSHPLPQGASHEQIADFVTARSRGGSIILLHFTERDIRALPLIIENLLERGYELVTLSEML